MKVTRRTKYTGQPVRVTFRDTSTIEGTLQEWGAQVMSIRPYDGQNLVGVAARECMGWKRETFSNLVVDSVEAL